MGKPCHSLETWQWNQGVLPLLPQASNKNHSTHPQTLSHATHIDIPQMHREHMHLTHTTPIQLTHTHPTHTAHICSKHTHTIHIHTPLYWLPHTPFVPHKCTHHSMHTTSHTKGTIRIHTLSTHHTLNRHHTNAHTTPNTLPHTHTTTIRMCNPTQSCLRNQKMREIRLPTDI